VSRIGIARQHRAISSELASQLMVAGASAPFVKIEFNLVNANLVASSGG
jgi:hypothetical protein